MRRRRQSPTLFMPVATSWQMHGQAKEPPRIGRLRESPSPALINGMRRRPWFVPVQGPSSR
eukprot:7974754-Pyramimonas_sp.AAC.1